MDVGDIVSNDGDDDDVPGGDDDDDDEVCVEKRRAEVCRTIVILDANGFENKQAEPTQVVE